MKKIKLQERKGYKWIVYTLCFLMIFVCLGFASTSKSIFLAPVTEALNIPRSAFSVSDTCRFVASAIVNAFFGSLITRFGAKKLILGGIIALIISMVLFATADKVFLFYVAGAVLGIGLSWTSTTIVGSIIMRWCEKGIGTVMGVILAANGVGSAVATQLLTPIIYEEGNKFGYKNAYFVIAAFLFILLLLFIFFFRESGNKRPLHNKKQPSKSSGWEGIHIKQAIKVPYFYIMAVYVFFSGMVLQGMVNSFAANLRDAGLNPSLIATVMSIYSIALTFSKILNGSLYDKLGIKPTGSICNLCAIATLIFMLFIRNSATGNTIAVISAVTIALALPLETIMLPIFASDMFGIKSYNDILGIFVSISYAGMALGAPIMNISYDIWGSYKTGFIISAAIMFLCCIIFSVASGQSNKFKKSIKNEETDL